MSSQLTIDTAGLRANFRAIERRAGCGVLAVIKADAYGHGAALCAPVLVGAGARWLGVTDAAEGALVRQALRAAGVSDATVNLLVMVGLNPEDCHGCDLVVEHALTPVLWTLPQLHALERAARVSGHRISVHIELDTGMNRQGVRPGVALHMLLAGVCASGRITLDGVMSHLACAEVPGAAASRTARQRLRSALTQVTAAGLKPRWLHLENTAAVDEGGSAAELRAMAAEIGAQPMVRTGLGLYGYALPLKREGQPAAEARLQPELQPVLQWSVPVMAIFDVAAGDGVGYGATFTAERVMRLALLPVGYADGFRRAASSGEGNGWIMLHGRHAPVVGRVSMNLLVVDVSSIPEANAGDPAVLLGPGVTAKDHAMWSGTIPYEILCGLRGMRRPT